MGIGGIDNTILYIVAGLIGLVIILIFCLCVCVIFRRKQKVVYVVETKGGSDTVTTTDTTPNGQTETPKNTVVRNKSFKYETQFNEKKAQTVKKVIVIEAMMMI